MAIKTDIATKNIVSKINSILKHTSNSKTQFYTFCDEMIKQHPELAKQMRVAVIEHRDIENHVIEPLNRIVIELKTENGQKQICYFALNGENATINNVDDNHKVVWKMPLTRYLKLYDNMDKVEEYLLKNSSIKELSKKEPKNIPDENKILFVNEIRKDVSTLARILIRGYVGWPYHDITTKIAVLDRLEFLYSEDQEMTIKEFKNKIGHISRLIPDNHLTIIHGRPRFRQPFAGQNYAVDTNVFFGHIDNTAIVALKTLGNDRLSKEERFDLRNLTKWASTNLPNSDALIVDLRGNGGGNDKHTNKFAEYLCGGVTNYPAIQEYVRTTKTANKTAQPNKFEDIKKIHKLPDSEEPQLYQPKHATYKNGDIIYINTDKAYMKPIYILIDKRTGSSAERFILAMRHHPMVRFVGDNSGGTEVFGNMSSEIYLPNSKAVIRVGTHYRSLDRELGHDHYELHGLKPDIRCREGEDAMQVALKDIENKQYTANFEQATTKIEQSMATIKTNRLKKEEKTL